MTFYTTPPQTPPPPPLFSPFPLPHPLPFSFFLSPVSPLFARSKWRPVVRNRCFRIIPPAKPPALQATFAPARNTCCEHKICVRDTKMFLISFKHFVSATNVSRFAQHRNNDEQQCVRNIVSSFATTFK